MSPEEAGRGYVEARVNGHDIHWRVLGAQPSHLGDAALALGLMPAMQSGTALEVGPGVSPRLLNQTDAIQVLLSSWDPGMKRVNITASPSDAPSNPGSGTGLFFSGGVDSFYSLVTHRGEITHLVTINGLDHFDDNRLADMCRAVAEEEGLQSIVVSTNARNAVKSLDWLQFGHGAVLASAGLLLQGELGNLLVASSSTPQTLKPVGTHPHLDPLWSTETLTFVHDAMLPRQKKLQHISGDPVAMKWLRVCWRAPQRYNCGECEKCLRTMIMLDLTGKLGICATLPATLDLRRVSDARLPPRGVIRWKRLLVAADDAGRADLARALRHAILKNQARNIAKQKVLTTLAPIGRLRRAVRNRPRRRPSRVHETQQNGGGRKP